MKELCYRNNPNSLFRKYAKLVNWFGNTGIGRDYIFDKQNKRFVPLKKQRIWIYPNGHKEYLGYWGGRHHFKSVASSRAIFAPKLLPALYLIDKFNIWMQDFDEARRVLLWQLGFLRTVPSVLKTVHLDSFTAYPDPDVETTTVDGNVSREAVNEIFGTIRAGAGTNAYPSNALLHGYYLAATATTDQYSDIYRFIDLYDVSGHVPDGDQIDTAVRSLWGRAAAGTGLGALNMALVGSTPATNTDLVAADYGQTGSTRYTDADLSSWTNGDYNDMTLNSTGRTNVSVTGVTKLASRVANDLDNSAPTWSSGAASNFPCFTADQAGTPATVNDPKLTVTHSAVAGRTGLQSKYW